MVVYRSVLLGFAISAFWINVDGEETLCPSRIATFPIALSAPAISGARFELRQCAGSSNVQIAAFENSNGGPIATINTYESWPVLLVHVSNVLVLQTVGGSHSVVYMFQFRHGKWAEPIVVTTSGTARVQVNDIRSKVSVDVPGTITSTQAMKDRHFEFTVEIAAMRW